MLILLAGCGDEASALGDSDVSPDQGGELELASPGPSPRVVRLTHAQWDNTTRDLFGLGEQLGYAETFRNDPQIAGYLFDNDATSLAVDAPLWTGYRIAAAEIAALVTSDQAHLDAWVPSDAADDPRAFLHGFATRAYRRPATESEVDALEALMAAAPELYPDEDDPFVAGLRHVAEAVLQSPFFLYRIEVGGEVTTIRGGDVVVLDDYEIAQRLSYFLWNTMPDSELLDAAAAGQLSTDEGLAMQAERMVADPRTTEVVTHFHTILLDLGGYDGILPSPVAFPDVPDDLRELAREETRRFVEDVVFEDDGGLVEMLSSSETYVNDDLAEIYGLSGEFGDDFVRVSLPPEQRSGVFTQVGFLASNASLYDPDPIHRGVFLATRFACLVIGAPPDAAMEAPATLEEGQTNRERIEEHTSRPACASCHETMINPFGFAFENFDAIGAWRDEDNGKPVDAAAGVLLGEVVEVDGPIELAAAMAESETVHRCYTQHWVEYAMGRNAEVEDDPLIHELGRRSLARGQSIRDLLVSIVSSPAFRYRSVREFGEE